LLEKNSYSLSSSLEILRNVARMCPFYLLQFVSGKKMASVTLVAPMAHHIAFLRHVQARRALICDNLPTSICYFRYNRGRLNKTKPHLSYNIGLTDHTITRCFTEPVTNCTLAALCASGCFCTAVEFERLQTE